MEPKHQIQNIRFENDYMFLTIDNQHLKIKLSDLSQKLGQASQILKNDYTISPSGYGIHWTQLNEDLSIGGILKQAQSV